MRRANFGYSSTFDGVTTRKSSKEAMAAYYEKMAYDAERAGDANLAQRLFNYAEHWKK